MVKCPHLRPQFNATAGTDEPARIACLGGLGVYGNGYVRRVVTGVRGLRPVQTYGRWPRTQEGYRFAMKTYGAYAELEAGHQRYSVTS